jgi:hypothetical protein
LEGFRLIGRKPGTFLVWCLAYFVVLIAIAVLTFIMAGPALMAAAQRGGGAPMNPAESVRMMLPAMAVIYPVLILWSVVFCCAIYRSILHPKDTGLAYLKICADEFRVILLIILMAVFACVVWFVGMMLLALLIGVMTAAMGKAAVGMFLLDLAMVVGIVIASYLVVGLFFAGAFLGALAGQGHAVAPQVGPLALVGGLVLLAVYFVMPTLIAVVMAAPFAAAYRDLTGPKEDEAAKAFA